MIFGFRNDGKRLQYNYIIDEAETPNLHGHGAQVPDAVRSMLHHALDEFGLEDSSITLQADTCGGMLFLM